MCVHWWWSSSIKSLNDFFQFDSADRALLQVVLFVAIHANAPMATWNTNCVDFLFQANWANGLLRVLLLCWLLICCWLLLNLDLDILSSRLFNIGISVSFGTPSVMASEIFVILTSEIVVTKIWSVAPLLLLSLILLVTNMLLLLSRLIVDLLNLVLLLETLHSSVVIVVGIYIMAPVSVELSAIVLILFNLVVLIVAECLNVQSALLEMLNLVLLHMLIFLSSKLLIDVVLILLPLVEFRHLLFDLSQLSFGHLLTTSIKSLLVEQLLIHLRISILLLHLFNLLLHKLLFQFLLLCFCHRLFLLYIHVILIDMNEWLIGIWIVLQPSMSIELLLPIEVLLLATSSVELVTLHSVVTWFHSVV